MLVHQLRVPLVDAARLCSSTPARQLGLVDRGRLEVGAAADLAVLRKTDLSVVMTCIGGQLAPASSAIRENGPGNRRSGDPV
jgi:N-acetylglucosamine-6-phosphate deacetylase